MFAREILTNLLARQNMKDVPIRIRLDVLDFRFNEIAISIPNLDS